MIPGEGLVESEGSSLRGRLVVKVHVDFPKTLDNLSSADKIKLISMLGGKPKRTLIGDPQSMPGSKKRNVQSSVSSLVLAANKENVKKDELEVMQIVVLQDDTKQEEMDATSLDDEDDDVYGTEVDPFVIED